MRTKLAKRLIYEGCERIQKSIYIATNNPKENKNLWNFIQNMFNNDDNGSLLIIPLSKNNFRYLNFFGAFDLDIAYVLGEKRSLII